MRRLHFTCDACNSSDTTALDGLPQGWTLLTRSAGTDKTRTYHLCPRCDAQFLAFLAKGTARRESP